MIHCIDSERPNNEIAYAAGDPRSSAICGSEYATFSSCKQNIVYEGKCVDPATRKAGIHGKPLVAPIVRTPNT
jgi:hypothetical protein